MTERRRRRHDGQIREQQRLVREREACENDRAWRERPPRAWRGGIATDSERELDAASAHVTLSVEA
jgi:hypothetical protein